MRVIDCPPGVVHFLFEVSTVVLVASGCFWPFSASGDRLKSARSGISSYLRKSGAKLVDLATGNATLDRLRGGTYDPHVEKLLDGVVIPSLVSYEKV